MVDSAKMAIYLYPGKILADHLSIKSHLRDAPRDTHGATADYDDTALGTGTLTVHPWRAGPDCGKFIYLFMMIWLTTTMQAKCRFRKPHNCGHFSMQQNRVCSGLTLAL